MGTKISWTDETWNPVVGCTKVSEGCQNCYAEKMACRLAYRELKELPDLGDKYLSVTKLSDYEKGKKQKFIWSGYAFCDESALQQPLHWKKPRQIFVCSMGDLFHKDVPFEFIGKVFSVAIAADWHTYQFLTKRVDRALEFATWFNKKTGLQLQVFKHIHFGTSCENQKTADERIPLLLQIPAAKRFISFEPLLGNIEIGKWLNGWCIKCGNDYGGKKCLSCGKIQPEWSLDFIPRKDESGDEYWYRKIDQIIIGSESIGGHAGRECKLEWVRSLVAQAKAAGCKVHVKQLHIDGKLVKDINQFPEDLRIQEKL